MVKWEREETCVDITKASTKIIVPKMNNDTRVFDTIVKLKYILLSKIIMVSNYKEGYIACHFFNSICY